MKTLLSYMAVAALILASSFTVNQQQKLNQKQQVNEQPSTNSCFNSFRVHRQGKAGVSVNWGVSSPDIVQFIVERSYDGEYFDVVNSVIFNGSSSYKYHDNDVYPGFIYYRITALMTDGSTESSSIDRVRIVKHG